MNALSLSMDASSTHGQNGNPSARNYFQSRYGGVHFARGTMKMRLHIRSAVIVAGLLLVAAPRWLAAQSTGSVEFTAQVAPTDGRPEPVRQLTFYLLRKSLEDIRQEALQLEPPPDLDKFVDALTVSPKLKTWMKKNRTVRLVGTDFTNLLTADDIVDTPEFYNAYILRNSGFEGTGFPKPKFKLKDQASNPEKFNEAKADYKEAVRKFINMTPESIQGIDSNLVEINPSAKWELLVAEQQRRLDKRALELAQTRYLAAQTDTNLDGRGFFAGLMPGSYWIDILGMQAVSGDVRLRWDFPVRVRPGETTRIELSNLNAAKPFSSARNSNH
jgi:hypothetical protein